MRLGDIAQISRGLSWSKSEECEDGVPVISIPNIRDGRVSLDVRHRLRRRIGPNQELDAGDVLLVGSSGSARNVGRAGVLREKPFPNLSFASFLVRVRGDASQVEQSYLYFLLNSPWADFASISKRAADGKFNLQVSQLRSLMLPLPTLAEQRAIAHVLSTVQRAREATEAVIAAARELKRSLMHHLFTYGPVPPAEAERVALQETEIGTLPRHWPTTTLGKLARIGNGSTPKRSNPRYWDGGTVPWLTSGKVHEVVIHQADEFVTPLAQAECHLPTVRKGSLVVAITGQGKTLGNAAMVTFDSCVSQHLAYIQFDDTAALPEYMLAFLQSRYAHFRQVAGAGGSTKGALTCAFLRQYAVPVPPPGEQRRTADMLRCLDRKVEAEEKRRAALEQLFRSLLQQLMTGQVRLDPIAILKEVE